MAPFALLAFFVPSGFVERLRNQNKEAEVNIHTIVLFLDYIYFYRLVFPKQNRKRPMNTTYNSPFVK